MWGWELVSKWHLSTPNETRYHSRVWSEWKCERYTSVQRSTSPAVKEGKWWRGRPHYCVLLLTCSTASARVAVMHVERVQVQTRRRKFSLKQNMWTARPSVPRKSVDKCSEVKMRNILRMSLIYRSECVSRLCSKPAAWWGKQENNSFINTTVRIYLFFLSKRNNRMYNIYSFSCRFEVNCHLKHFYLTVP